MKLSPDEAGRVAATTQPEGRLVMYQKWRQLLFLHWEYAADIIQSTLPEGLFVDTFEGKAYLGIVPFFMADVRPRFLPTVPGISDFMELNVRTYVYDRSGVPGVWFYSLDANQWLAVELARRFFHLPYVHAEMNFSQAGSMRYQSQRRDLPLTLAGGQYEYLVGESLPAPAPSSLEFFLVERYRLYSQSPSGLRRGSVLHRPYPIYRAQLKQWDESPLVLDGFAAPNRPPDHCLFSPGVDVRIFGLVGLSHDPSKVL